MKWRVHIRPAAENDLKEARVCYDQQREGLGDEFLVSIVESITRLEGAPEHYRVYYNGFRRILVKRFPYKLFYRVRGDTVIVFRVLHNACDHTRQRI